MKIQINNLAALERLIGGDSELEIEIRNSVVQDFTKKHLKPIATEAFLTNYAYALAKQVKAEIEKEMFECFSPKWILRPEIKEDLVSGIKSKIYAELYEFMDTDAIKQELIDSARLSMEGIMKQFAKERIIGEIKSALDDI